MLKNFKICKRSLGLSVAGRETEAETETENRSRNRNCGKTLEYSPFGSCRIGDNSGEDFWGVSLMIGPLLLQLWGRGALCHAAWHITPDRGRHCVPAGSHSSTFAYCASSDECQPETQKPAAPRGKCKKQGGMRARTRKKNTQKCAESDKNNENAKKCPKKHIQMAPKFT